MESAHDEGSVSNKALIAYNKELTVSNGLYLMCFKNVFFLKKKKRKNKSCDFAAARTIFTGTNRITRFC